MALPDRLAGSIQLLAEQAQSRPSSVPDRLCEARVALPEVQVLQVSLKHAL